MITYTYPTNLIGGLANHCYVIKEAFVATMVIDRDLQWIFLPFLPPEVFDLNKLVQRKSFAVTMWLGFFGSVYYLLYLVGCSDQSHVKVNYFWVQRMSLFYKLPHAA